MNNFPKPKREPTMADEPKTLVELFDRLAKERPRKDALAYRKDGIWHKISTDEMMRRAENIALGFYALGTRHGDRIALISNNCPEWTLADLGCQFSGVVDVPIYTTQGAPQIEYILNDSGARFLILQNKDFFNRLQDILPNCPTLEKLIFFDFEREAIDTDDALSLAEIEAEGERLRTEYPDLLQELKAAVTADDIATLIYTSGTTGEPKGVMLAHENLVSNIFDTGAAQNFTPADIELSLLPLSHIFERNGLYLYLWCGMGIYYAESLEKVPENLREVRPTVFVGVPRLYEKIFAKAREKAEKAGGLTTKIFNFAIATGKEFASKSISKQPISLGLKMKHALADKLVFSKLREVFGGRVKFCISGGAALADEIMLIFHGAGLPIYQGYGLTETSPVVTSSTAEALKLGTVGKPLRELEVKIAEDGEILVRGANVMRGYYNKPEATKEVFTPDGFFKTGDIGEIDNEGFLKITDRKKELFKTSGGKYIAPSQIEQAVKASRYVNQIVVVGNNRKFPAALIVPDFEQLESYAKAKNLALKSPAEFCRHAEIIQLLQSEVDTLTKDAAKYEKIKKVALIETEMTVEGGELTPTLKVKRRVVDEKYRDVIDELYKE